MSLRHAAPAVRGPRWPLAVVSLYALLVPLQPVLTMPDGSPLRFAAAEAVAPFVFLAAVLHPRRRLPAGVTALAVAIPLFAIVSTVAAAAERSLSWYAVGKTGGLVYLTGLALAVVRCLPAENVPAVLRALTRGALWSALLGLVGYAAWLAGVTTPLVSYGRLCSTMPGDPNIYGSLLAVGLLLTAMDHGRDPTRRLAGGTILALALVATGSRSGVVGAGVGLVIGALIYSRDPWAAAARGVLVVTAVGTAAMLIAATGVGSGVTEALRDHLWRTWTVDSRFALYARAFEQFADHPLLGLGVGGFRELNTWFESASWSQLPVHNTYLWALVDLGLVGGLLLTGLIAAALLRCVRAARRRPPAEGASAIAAALAAMAGFNLFVDGFYQRHFWVLMACALGLPTVRRRTGAPAWSWPRAAELPVRAAS